VGKLSDSDLARFLRDYIVACEADNQRRGKYLTDRETEGFRLVTGGNNWAYDDDGEQHMIEEYHDARTGRLLYRGTVEDDQPRFWPDGWWHVDNDREDPDELFIAPVSDAYPPSLADVIGDWAYDNAKDVAAVAGLDADRVRQALGSWRLWLLAS
jgi:hypothetical protein